jgi:exopolyphosphatase / guanosine-5'-triphosphate,3'-diphosphate pyrophosphatase
MDPIAVVDIGTNSTRLLVATVEHGSVRELERRTKITRLGQGVDSSGRLADEAVERVMQALAEYRRLIDEHGATTTVALATSAVRDSVNGDDFRRQLKERFGLDARTISGDEEARLTFLGATNGRAQDEPTLVIDIGGGSTEFVVGKPGQNPDFHVSTQAGSVRQTERHMHSDPPSRHDLDELQREVRKIIEENVPADVRRDVTRAIAVAGTATQLAAIDQELDTYDSEQVHGYALTLASCRAILERLASVPLEQRREITGMHPDRAPTITAGTAILVEAIEAFGLDVVETSETDILHGAALSVAATPNG